MSYSNGLGNVQNAVTTVPANGAQRSEAASNASTKNAAASGVPPSQDQTRFSSTSGVLGQSLSGPDVRMPKVQELSAAIAAGTYQVPSSDVAGKMIDALLK